MLKNSLIRQPTEEDPDEGLKDLVEITLKKMVRGWMLLAFSFQWLYFHLFLHDACCSTSKLARKSQLFIFLGPGP